MSRMPPEVEEANQRTLIRRAPAKVNLFLAAGPLRPDGYHEILTLLEAVPPEDIVTVTVRRLMVGSTPQVIARSPDETLPRDLDNLAGRAADRYLEAMGEAEGFRRPVSVEIGIDKHIPAAAGLGGGSSDAAAVLAALQDHFEEALDTETLLRVAAGLGSDVPFFLTGRHPAARRGVARAGSGREYAGRAVGRGRGEIVAPVPASCRLPLVLGLPAFGLSTPEVYRRFEALERRPLPAAPDEAPRDEAPRDTPAERETARAATAERQLDQLLQALRGGRLQDIAGLLRNDLEGPAADLRPEIAEVLAALMESGCLAARMSGSGPAVFGLAAGFREAKRIARTAGDKLPAMLRDRMVFRPVLSLPRSAQA